MSYLLFLFFLIAIKCFEGLDNAKNNTRKLQSGEYENIRIYIDAKCLLSTENNTDIHLINQSIYKAKETIEKLVKVRRVERPIYLPNIDIRSGADIHTKFDGCINPNILTSSFEADLVVFIREHSAVSDGQVDYASSSIIKYDNLHGNRPLVGTISYKHENILSLYDDKSKFQAMSTIFLHEFTHILGFNKTILQNKKIIYSKQTKSRMNNNITTKYFVNGTNVLNRAKSYFNCPDLEGVELDDINGNEAQDGSSIHWSARILMGDYMIAGVYYAEQAISELTLALLEDLGDWYEVNYYTGGLMRFGKNKGCDFFTKDCVEEVSHPIHGLKIKTTYTNEFCSNIYEIDSSFGTCTSGRQSIAQCSNYYSHRSIKTNDPGYTRNTLLTPNDGFSSIKLIEYCPYSESDIATVNPNYNYQGNCKIGNYGSSNEFDYHIYGNTSFCAFSSMYNSNRETPEYVKNSIKSNCYNMSCSEKSLTIHVGDEYIVCPRKGGIIKLESNYSSYRGLFFCPDYNLICTGTVLCNNLFDCVEKGSIAKNLIYDYTVNNNVSIEVTTIDVGTITNDVNNINSENVYEEGEEGVCPKDCQQCIANKQCTTCRPGYIYYIGTKEGDDEEIKCSNTFPTEGYYNLKKDGKEFYYKCSENCITCKNLTICEQCSLKYYVNGTGQCVERIPGCTLFDETSITNMPDNGNAPSYIECLNCNDTANYYCLDKNKSICNLIPNINMSIYVLIPYLNYSCYEKCRDRFKRCETCISSTCLVCNESNLYINSWGNCLQEIDYCERYNLIKHEPECLHCREDQDYYCIKML